MWKKVDSFSISVRKCTLHARFCSDLLAKFKSVRLCAVCWRVGVLVCWCVGVLEYVGEATNILYSLCANELTLVCWCVGHTPRSNVAFVAFSGFSKEAMFTLAAARI